MLSPLRALVLFLAMGLPVSPARAEMTARLMLPGSIRRVVTAGGHVAVIRGNDVIFIGEDGRTIGQLGAHSAPGDSERNEGRRRDDDLVFDLLGVDEEYREESWAEEQREDETTLAERRSHRREARAAASRSPRAPALAVVDGEIWATSSTGVWRLTAVGDLERIAGPERAGPLLAAVPGPHAIVGRESGLWLLTADGAPRLLVHTPGRLRALAGSASGRLAWATDDMLWTMEDIRSGGVQTRPLHAQLSDLRYCGESLLLASEEGLWIHFADATEHRFSRVRAKRIACSVEAGAPWFAVGHAMSASQDSGHTWVPYAPLPTDPVTDLALGERCLWLATKRGLLCLAWPLGDGQDGVVGQLLDLSATPPRPAVRRTQHEIPWWTSWLPVLVLQAGMLSAPGERQLQAVAFARFPFDRVLPTSSSVLETAALEPADSPLLPVVASAPPIANHLDQECLAGLRNKAVALALAEPERALSYVQRARRAAWLPELRIRVDRRFGRTESLDLPASTASASPLGLDTVNDVRYEGRASWDLAKLVFSSEELAAQAQALHMAETRREIETTVGRLYFERERLRLEPLPAGTDRQMAGLRRELRMREIEAELNAMTGGASAGCMTGRTIGDGYR